LSNIPTLHSKPVFAGENTIPMPNDPAKEFVARIREAKKAPAQPR
jgi:hypothetical protein